MTGPQNFRIKLLGYRKREVDSYFQKLKENHSLELSQLQRQLEETLSEKYTLSEKLDRLQEKWATRFEGEDFITLTVNRVKEMTEILMQKAALDAEKVLKEAEKEQAADKQKIADIEEEIVTTKKQIKSLLEELASIMKDTEKSVPETEQLSNKIIKLNEIINERNLRNQEKDLSDFDSNDQWAEEKEIAADGTPFFESENEKREDEEAGRLKRMMNKLAQKLNKEEITKEDFTAEAAEEESGSENISANHEEIEEFWKTSDTENNSTQENRTQSIQKAEDMLDHYKTQTSEMIKTQLKDYSDEKIENSTEENASSDGGNSGSPAVASEIINTRFKYIAGKLAGKDLIGNNGEAIITKGATITKEIISKAETEGKLPELIVNMVLPGMED